MKISDIKIKTFRTHADRWDSGHAVPLKNAELRQTVLTIETDEGISGTSSVAAATLRARFSPLSIRN